MSKSIDLWEDYSSMSYMVKELSKEMESVVKLAMKPIHEHIDRIVQRRTQNLHRPTRRTWRNLNEDDESVDRHSFVSNRRPSQDLESFYARMDQCIKNALQEYNSENIITTIPTIQSPKEEMVVEFDSSADTEEDGGAEPEMLLEKELDDAEIDQEMLSEEEPAAEEIEAPGEHVLVSNQALNVQIHVGEEEQQENTFHTKYEVKDKVTKQMKDPIHISKYEDDVELQEESGPKKKKKKKKKKKQKKLNGRDIMQWAFLARMEGFVFDPNIDDSDLRTNPSQEEGNDAVQGPNIHDSVQVLIGPITRARAKKFKDVLFGLIQEVWAQELSKKSIGDDGPSSPRVVNLIEANGLDLEDN